MTDAKAEQPISKPVTAQPAEGLLEHSMGMAQEMGEPQDGAVFFAPGKLASANGIVKTDVKAPGKLESEEKSKTTEIVKAGVGASDEL